MTAASSFAQTPVIVGTMAFCPHCGDLMDPPSRDPLIVCQTCKYTHAIEDNSIRVISKSQPSAFQSSLRSKRELVQKQSIAREKAATIQEECPKCQAPEMSFHTMQLRSADEGQTVFYNCIKCGSSLNQTETLEVSPVVEPLVSVNPTASHSASWPVALVYLLFVLVINNLNPLMGRFCLAAVLIQYILQGVPLVLGLTGLGPRAVLYQFISHLTSWGMPDNELLLSAHDM